jgi:SAM-dependent methyltransferase
MLKRPASIKDDFIKLCKLTDKEISVLEYGCGTGIDARYFLNEYPNIVKYIGIDNSKEMLRKFDETFSQEKVECTLSDIDDYSPAVNEYDLVFGMYFIHYTNNLENLMKKTYSALKSNGYFCFRDAHPLVGFFKKKSKKYDVKEVVEFPLAGGGSGINVKHPTFTFQEYVNYASAAGFKILSLN